MISNERVRSLERFGQAGLCLLALLGVSSFASGSTGITHDTPSNSLSGLRLRLETHWVESYGYRPVQFTLTAKTPANRDRLVTLRVYTSDWSFNFRQAYDRHQLAVEQDFVLPAGQISVSKEILIPQLSEWAMLWWDAWVDGRKDAALSISENEALGHTGKQENYLCVLRVHPSAKVPPVQTQIGITEHPTLQSVRVDYYQSTLPEQDLKYSAVDAVLVKASQLAALLEESPAGKAALLRWVHSGGTLWIDHVGNDFQGLASVTSALSLEDLETPAGRLGRPVDDLLPWRWVSLRPKLSRVTAEDVGERILGRSNRRALAPEQDQKATQREVRGWYAELPLGLGRILAFEKAWYQPPTNEETEIVRSGRTNLLQAEWSRRHGIEPVKGAREFANFLPPKVGVAPVVEFQVLMSLFALVVGPLSYWLFRQRQQRHLMIITTPLIALALTIGLISYSIMSDGFGTYLRVRSLTVIDQKSNHASCWSRLSYYAGAAPSDRMAFDDSTAIYPIASSAGGARNRMARRLVEWVPAKANGNADETDTSRPKQLLKEGWLPTRETTQFLQIRTFKANLKRLSIQDGDQQVAVTNELGSALEWVVVRDRQGDYWRTNSVAVDGNAVLKRTKLEDFRQELTKKLSEHRPKFPEGWSSDWNGLSPSRRKSEASTQLSDNRMNRELESLISPLNEEPLAPGAYLAITKEPTHLDPGLTDVDLVAGFHVVVGNW